MQNKERTYLDLGSYNVICDRCGKKVKNTKAKKEWTGLIVCGRCLDERHPQDFVRARVDHMAVPVARPLPNYTYLTIPTTGISGSLLTPLPSGPENIWDNGNIVNVNVIGGALTSATELQVLGGANLIAIQGANGWEILQFQTATLVSGTTYNLTKLLRARYGTYQNMGAPQGARFVYLGQASSSVSDWIQTELGINVLSQLNVSIPVPIYIQNIITTLGIGSIVVPQGVTNMKAECIGGGGGCQNSLYYAGGGGGAYARTNKINVVPGKVIYYKVGAGGIVNGNGSSSWINTSATTPSISATGCLADYGRVAVNNSGGGAGLSTNSIGDLTSSGGQGGHAVWNGGGGGGGAGGPNGPGGAGGSSLPTGGGGGGGGGANGGAAGASSSTDNGGKGGDNYTNSGGGAGGLTGNPGGYGGLGLASGGGGGAGAATVGNNNGGPGGLGGSDSTFDMTHGCGGGGGGGGAATGSGVDGTGGTGGLFGGGGAASGGWSGTGIGAPGAQGIVVITFYP